MFLIVLKNLMSLVGSRIGLALTISGLAPVGILCASSVSFLSSMSTFVTIVYFSKIKYDILS